MQYFCRVMCDYRNCVVQTISFHVSLAFAWSRLVKQELQSIMPD